MKRVCIISALAMAFLTAIASGQPTGELLKTLDQLTEQNRLLANQNQQLTDQIESLRQAIGTAVQTAPRDVAYKMTNVDRDVRYLGFPLDGMHYWRWLESFRGLNTIGLKGLFDHGPYVVPWDLVPGKDRYVGKAPARHTAVPFTLRSTRFAYDPTAEPPF